MAAFEDKQSELKELGVTVFAGSVDTGDNAQKVAATVSFPVAQGVTREIADRLGAWWEDRRAIVQPSEFLIRGDGAILNSSYSDGPLARTQPEDVCALVNFVKKS